MAEIASELESYACAAADSCAVMKWENLTPTDDTGTSGDVLGFYIASVQVTGEFKKGDLLLIEGSNDGVNWESLWDTRKYTLKFKNESLKTFSCPTRYIRPRLDRHSTGTDVSIYIAMRKANA